ncbi:SH3 domain-containing protein [Hyphomicrobium sp. 99]|uniref:SH3 domain-containing protein n=1 Tax=Hyphomicrobium sp. 99 TaxID=1163419 RepID=UPI0009E19230
MKIQTVICALVGSVVLGISTAEAAPGYATANVNLRAGPDIDYPSVGIIPDSDPVDVRGCLRDESWCDVIWAGNRGWVYSEYLALDYRGEPRPLPDYGVAAFGIPIIAFSAAEYWNHYYVGRPWYGDRARWFAYTPRPRPGWHAPPPGPRQPGWWRGGGYRPPQGMQPPPDRGWRPHPGPGNIPGGPPRGPDDRRRGLDDRMKGPGNGPGGPGERPRGPEDRPRGHEDRPRGQQDRPRGQDDRPRGPDDRPRGP